MAVMGRRPISARCVLWSDTEPINQTFVPSLGADLPAADKEEEETRNVDKDAMTHLLVVVAVVAVILGVGAHAADAVDHTRGQKAWNKVLARTVRVSMILLMQALVVRIHL